MRRWKNIFHANRKKKKAGIAIVISDKIDLKIRKVTGNKEGHYIMIKGSIQEEDITIVNIYAPNIGAPQYIRQTLTDIKGEIDSNTVIVGTLTPHSHQWTDHQNRKLIRKHKCYMMHEMRWILLISSGHSIQMQNTPSSQVHMDHSPG